MSLILQGAASGVVTGCVYALVALSLVIVYKSTDVVNFAGGELVMVGGYLGLLFLLALGLPYPLMFVAVPVAVFVLGALFDRITLNKVGGRGVAKHADLVPLVVATIGLSYLLKGAVRVVPYTEEVRRLPPLFQAPPIFLGDVVLQAQDLAIIGVTIVIMAALWVFFRHTMIGKAMRATSQNPRAAALIGIPVKTMRMTVWGLASAIAGIAGVLLAPKLLMTPDMGSVVMLAFAAAIVGGFTSLPGCVVGGIVLGVLQNLVGIFISPQAIVVTPFFIIMLVLLIRPQGLFGEAITLKKV
ncbi:MAG TPA: branched-chain amino acid ABC transporter permease [Stellaceae bacterium]|nr:branched-chain amino acid ABC transporter permease [Stellaceae bacterium]